MEKKYVIKSILTTLIIFGATTVLFLYSSGYRVQREERTNTVDIKKTGMISAKSIPEGASVYINDKLITATNDTISGIDPGIQRLKIAKNGFVGWTKDIEVFPELVTDITAVLVSQTPRLEPLTNTGAKYPIISPSLNKIAYFSNDTTTPGIGIITLGQEGLSIFKSNPYIVLKDTPLKKYSNGISIEWSPDEKTILVQNLNNTYSIVDLYKNTAESTSTPTLIRKDWSEQLLKKRTDFIQKLDLSEEIKELAKSEKSMWAPDDKKFLYINQNGDKLDYHVYNMEKPIPVGEKIDSLVFSTNVKEPQPKVSWYADSFHLILTENDIEKNKKGTVSLIRIDGTNKTEIYNNTLYNDKIYSAPGGEKLVILTSFKSNEQTDLYTLGIR